MWIYGICSLLHCFYSHFTHHLNFLNVGLLTVWIKVTHKRKKKESSSLLTFIKKKRTCSEGPSLHPYIFSFTRTRKSHDRCACSAIQLKYHSSLLWCSIYIAWHSNSLTYLPLRTTGQLHTASAHFVCSNPEILPSSQTE